MTTRELPLKTIKTITYDEMQEYLLASDAVETTNLGAVSLHRITHEDGELLLVENPGCDDQSAVISQ
jgi:hypothetical protein